MLIERALAAGEIAGPVKQLLGTIADQILNPLIQLGFAVALIYFFWGAYSFIKDSAAEKKTDGKRHLVFGILGLAIMVSVWGILQVVCDNVACR